MPDRFDLNDDDDDSLDEFGQIQDLIFNEIQAFEEEEDEIALAAAGIIVYLDEEIRKIRNTRRAYRRQYLLRAELLPDPRSDTPWQALYNHQNARGFITTMGFDPETFQLILDSGFQELSRDSISYMT